MGFIILIMLMVIFIALFVSASLSKDEEYTGGPASDVMTFEEYKNLFLKVLIFILSIGIITLVYLCVSYTTAACLSGVMFLIAILRIPDNSIIINLFKSPDEKEGA